MKNNVSEWNESLKEKSTEEVLASLLSRFGNRIVLASSLGAEDQVLTHIVATISESSRIFVLDTGRLHQETYDVLDKTRERYGVSIEVYFPKSENIEKLVNEKGINSFYKSIENRKECCFIRKVEPLNRVLKSADAWITGIRKDQSVTRSDIQLAEWDEAHGILKFNPLANWSQADVWGYIKKHDIPYNQLHDKGFPSIGCAPCTRAIEPGEELRAGRWWWEDEAAKECGLHVKSETKKEATA